MTTIVIAAVLLLVCILIFIQLGTIIAFVYNLKQIKRCLDAQEKLLFDTRHTMLEDCLQKAAETVEAAVKERPLKPDVYGPCRVDKTQEESFGRP